MAYALTSATLLAEATIEIGSGGPFHTPKIALYTNDVYPSKGAILEDFTTTDFAGLTNLQAVTWGTPWVNDNGQAELLGARVDWLTTEAPVDTITAYGYVLTNSAGDTLLLAERFATPLSFQRSGQQESIIPRLVFDS
jgi:hypothetical protein